MAFVLNSNIIIGQFKGVKPNAVSIKKSIYEYVDKAVIKLPISARLKNADGIALVSVQTAQQFSEGDAVAIDLGYNGSLKNEFTGFVSRVNFTSPVEVECEGYSYQLRKKTYLKTFKQVELKEVLQYLIEGTDIILDEKNIPSFKLEKFVLQNHSGTEALEMIKKDSSGLIKIFFTGKLLYAGLQYLQTKAEVKYKIGWNTIRDGNLKQRLAKNENVTVHYIGEKKDGTKVKVQVNNKTVTKDNVIKTTGGAGATGETKVIKTHAITDESTLNALADAKLKQLSYDGYEGNITAFLHPYCEPGYKGILTDDKYAEIGGNYLCESIEVKYTMQGARRIVGIGIKL